MCQIVPTAAYRPFPNQFRADLLAGKRLIGCWASLGAPITAEILGLADEREQAAAAMEQALALYERKGNLVMAERIRDRLTDLRQQVTS